MSKKISVVISTYNRPVKVAKTIECFSNQTIPTEDYEIVIVDNGSKEPVVLAENLRQKDIKLIRFEQNKERSISRSTAVNNTIGELIVFSDDDLIVESDFLEHHIKAHTEWDKLMAIGKIILPPERLSEPGIRFRQELEQLGIPTTRGLVKIPNFGTAANMSISRELFLNLGGFDPELAGIEDQDFAMRHTANGGNIAYLPEAVAIHDDDWLDFNSFCKRQAFAAEWAIPFSRRYPNWGDSVERERVNGALNFGREPISLSVKKIIKSALGTTLGKSAISLIIGAVEKLNPNSSVLKKLYSQVLGVYVQEGYRRGIEKYKNN
jgi:glycosyltransferase involved in cell wall biosynthesis